MVQLINFWMEKDTERGRLRACQFGTPSSITAMPSLFKHLIFREERIYIIVDRVTVDPLGTLINSNSDVQYAVVMGNLWAIQPNNPWIP